MAEQTAEPVLEMEEQPTVPQGETGGVTEKQTDIPEETGHLPPLTYVDFLPQCLGTNIEGKEPKFSEFMTVMEQANQWLATMPQFSVYKCETIDSKLSSEFKADADVTLSHQSSNGRNVYIRGLRLWAIPELDGSQATQQLAYVTVLPDHSSGNLQNVLESMAGGHVDKGLSTKAGHNFDTLSNTMEKLNKHLQTKPLPGKILTVETLPFKAQESSTSDKLNTEETVWAETGSNHKFFLYALRIIYVVGQPAYETIGLHDEVPDMLQNTEGMGLKVRFSTFCAVVNKASQWLKMQEGIRVINIQSVNIKLERKYTSGPLVLNADNLGFMTNQSLMEQRYAKVLRITYIKNRKLEKPSPYSSISMTSRLFAPKRIDDGVFEGFSKTMLRVIKWLNSTGIPLFACESVQYQVNTDRDGKGFNDERTDTVVNTQSGRQYLTCIRLYFPTVFQEPPEDIETASEEGWGWYACVIS